MADFKLHSTVYSASFKNKTYFNRIIDECKQVVTDFFIDQNHNITGNKESYSSSNIGNYSFLKEGKAGAGGAVVSENHAFIPLAYINSDGSRTGFKTDKTTHVLTYGAAAQGKDKNGNWMYGPRTQMRATSPGVVHKRTDDRESYAGVSIMPIDLYDEYLSNGKGFYVDSAYMSQTEDEFAESIFNEWLEYYGYEAKSYYGLQTGVSNTDYEGTIGRTESFDSAIRETRPDTVEKVKSNPFIEAIMKGGKAGNKQLQNIIGRSNNSDKVPTSINYNRIRKHFDPAEGFRPGEFDYSRDYLFEMTLKDISFISHLQKNYNIIIEHRR